ncbi:MAG TPA: MiaB/RimO family radical SAM methylthiotransferase [Candidatus Polarisedimenticolia bacterium]|nr:MiaB/RimO family radical SAM methylthiotransferase [Candidatus Polarisedimenticolia bacterium]
MPTYRIVTLGCKLNQSDSAGLETRLRALGLTRAPAATLEGGAGRGDAPEPAADVVVLNTCTVTGGADREARQIARRLRRANPAALLLATGCYAERDAEELRSAAEIDHVVGLRDQAGQIVRLVGEFLADRRTEAPREIGLLGAFGATAACDPGPDAADRTRVYLKVQDGCDLRCSYCIIPAVRGGSRSVSPGEILLEIGLLVERGYREIVLTGVNTGDYGKDLDPPLRLRHLLEQAVRVPGLGRLRLNSLEPKTVTPDLADFLADCGGRVAPHIQIPLQSGCDTVLAQMRRPYRTAEYAGVVEALRRRLPSIGLGADVIVGFPGETDEEFEATFRFISASPLNYLHVFSYSSRPGTPAATLPGRVPPPAVRERSSRLRSLGSDLSLRFRHSQIGRRLPVLTLRQTRRDGRLRALSDNFIDLGLDLAGRPGPPLYNQILEARITEATESDTLAAFA